MQRLVKSHIIFLLVVGVCSQVSTQANAQLKKEVSQQPIPVAVPINKAVSSGSAYEWSIAGGWPQIAMLGFGRRNRFGETWNAELGYTAGVRTDSVEYTIASIAVRYQKILESWSVYFGTALGYKITTAMATIDFDDSDLKVDAFTETSAGYLQPFVGYTWFERGKSKLSSEIGFAWAYWYSMNFKSNSLDLDETDRHSVYNSDEYEKTRTKVRDSGNEIGRSTFYAKLIQYSYRM